VKRSGHQNGISGLCPDTNIASISLKNWIKENGIDLVTSSQRTTPNA
jgi:hypothetical protein